MNWLARLKKIDNPPEGEATKPTKPIEVGIKGGFVGFVAPYMAPMPKTRGEPDAANDPAPEPPPDPNAWRELAEAYHAHHFNCKDCIAAGRGAIYGLRCGVGAALWSHYQSN